jgi:hypothetical protein
MTRKRNVHVGVALIVLVAALGVGQTVLEKTAVAQGGAQAPMFEVDPLWPKPLPNHWVIGSTIGVWADAQDHVWVIHRAGTLAAGEVRITSDPPSGECCAPAPPVLEFDQDGTLLRHWGGPGPGYDWPQSNHGIFIDHLANVWIGGNGGGDSHVLKFTQDGTFLKQFGRPNARLIAGTEANPRYTGDSNDTESYGRVAKIFVDANTNEAYLADGYLNKRVAVLDGETGMMKRYWGAYANRPDDSDSARFDPDAAPPQQFGTPVHCADLANDGLVYVCDRPQNRIQVFTREGEFVREKFIQNQPGYASAWDVAFSHDPEQRFLYLADATNAKVHILLRETLEELTSFGDGGRQPGQFYGVHSIATDSQGNIFTTETFEGKRVQKFVYKGLGPVTSPNQGVVWPTGAAQ